MKKIDPRRLNNGELAIAGLSTAAALVAAASGTWAGLGFAAAMVTGCASGLWVGMRGPKN